MQLPAQGNEVRIVGASLLPSSVKQRSGHREMAGWSSSPPEGSQVLGGMGQPVAERSLPWQQKEFVHVV